jgi:hypothetical protein
MAHERADSPGRVTTTARTGERNGRQARAAPRRLRGRGRGSSGATDSGADATFVLAVQVLRLFVMLLSAPLVARVLRRSGGT